MTLLIPIQSASDRWIKVVPWQGLPGIEAPGLPGGRKLTKDGIIQFGTEHRGDLLTQTNSHYIAFIFQFLVERKAPAYQLDVVWDAGVAMISTARVKKNVSERQGLIAYWTWMRRNNVDFGEGYFAKLAGGEDKVVNSEELGLVFSMSQEMLSKADEQVTQGNLWAGG